jgi:hypothetical protein
MLTAVCMGGIWQLSSTSTNCNPPPMLACPPTLPVAGTGCFGVNATGLMCVYPSSVCVREDAWCSEGVWQVDACKTLGGAGGEGGVGGEPNVGVAGAWDGAGAGGAP